MLEVKKFSAAWCGPCRALAPVMNEIKGQFNNVKFTDYDVDEAYEAATEYGLAQFLLWTILLCKRWRNALLNPL